MVYAEDDYLMLSGIQHFQFCKRQWALIHIEQQWLDNEATAHGQVLHTKADNPYIKENEKSFWSHVLCPFLLQNLDFQELWMLWNFIKMIKVCL